MRRILLILILISSDFSNAQNFWKETAPFPDSSNYSTRNISIVDDHTVWVSGANPNANFSDRWSLPLDGGKTCSTGEINLNSPTLQVSNIYGISNTTADVAVHFIMSIEQGGIWANDDSGVTWNRHACAYFNTLGSLKFTAVPNPTSGFAIILGKNIPSVSIFDLSGKKVLFQNFKVSGRIA